MKGGDILSKSDIYYKQKFVVVFTEPLDEETCEELLESFDYARFVTSSTFVADTNDRPLPYLKSKIIDIANVNFEIYISDEFDGYMKLYSK